jgi:hypothetical protein
LSPEQPAANKEPASTIMKPKRAIRMLFPR